MYVVLHETFLLCKVIIFIVALIGNWKWCYWCPYIMLPHPSIHFCVFKLVFVRNFAKNAVKVIFMLKLWGNFVVCILQKSGKSANELLWSFLKGKSLLQVEFKIKANERYVMKLTFQLSLQSSNGRATIIF